MQPRIVVWETGVVYPIGPEFVIGRDEEVDLSLPDPLVSRRHCVIRDLQIHEYGSLNGTRLNGKRVVNKLPVNGLTPGSTYSFRVKAIGGTTGNSDWSDPVSHMSM